MCSMSRMSCVHGVWCMVYPLSCMQYAVAHPEFSYVHKRRWQIVFCQWHGNQLKRCARFTGRGHFAGLNQQRWVDCFRMSGFWGDLGSRVSFIYFFFFGAVCHDKLFEAHMWPRLHHWRRQNRIRKKKKEKIYGRKERKKKERKAQWTGTTQLSMHNAHDFKPAIFFSSGNIFNAFA